MIYNLIMGVRRGAKAPANPWHGSTMEWQIDSPPSLENFESAPIVKENPYDYN
jgi:cytochrome c oxidase subunit 1